jgi:outer membrane immunogenic protein
MVAGFTPAGVPISATASGSNTRVGWTVGGGVEWKFSPNWSAKTISGRSPHAPG